MNTENAIKNIYGIIKHETSIKYNCGSLKVLL